MVTWLKYMPPLGKLFSYLGKGWVESTWWPMAWHGLWEVTEGLHSEVEVTKCDLTECVRKEGVN